MLATRRKILFIHASAEIGGTEISSYQLVSRLDHAKFEVRILFDSAPGPILDFYRASAIPFLVCRSPRLGPALRFIREFGPEIIQIYGLRTGVIWRPLLSMMGHRNIFGVLQGLTNYGEEPSWIRMTMDRLTNRWQTSYIVISKAMAQKLIDAGFDPRRVQVIYNGISVPDTLPAKPVHDIPRIVCVANLRSVKGHRYLLEALKILRESGGVSFLADIVGSGPDMDSLVHLSKAYQTDSVVRFCGRVDSIEPYLQSADIFALLSLSEGLSGAILEAMSRGLPVVATRVGGNPELISDGVEGYLVPPRAPGAAADRLSGLLKDPPLRQRMGTAGYQKVKTTFNLERTIREYEALYDRF